MRQEKTMASQELEVTIEIHCIRLPSSDWQGQCLHLGIQEGKVLGDAVSVDVERVGFRPVVRARRHDDGSVSFLGPFAQGPRAERFIYLVWASGARGAPAAMIGRIKLHLSHITWAQVEKAAARGKPLKVTLPLTNAKGGPVFASVRADACRWEM
jgi:hypothetical protein